MNIELYLNDEEKKEIAQRAFYDSMCKEFSGSGVERILYYVTEEYVRQLIAESMGENYKNLISEKVLSAVNSLDKYEVFRENNTWSRESIARKYLNEAMHEHKQNIFDRLKEVIDDKDVGYFEGVIQDCAYEFISENLFKKKG